MMIKIMNKLYPGKANYKKRNAIYRKDRNIIDGLKFILGSAIVIAISYAAICAIFIPIIVVFSIAGIV